MWVRIVCIKLLLQTVLYGARVKETIVESSDVPDWVGEVIQMIKKLPAEAKSILLTKDTYSF